MGVATVTVGTGNVGVLTTGVDVPGTPPGVTVPDGTAVTGVRSLVGALSVLDGTR